MEFPRIVLRCPGAPSGHHGRRSSSPSFLAVSSASPTGSAIATQRNMSAVKPVHRSRQQGAQITQSSAGVRQSTNGGQIVSTQTEHRISAGHLGSLRLVTTVIRALPDYDVCRLFDAAPAHETCRHAFSRPVRCCPLGCPHANIGMGSPQTTVPLFRNTAIPVAAGSLFGTTRRCAFSDHRFFINRFVDMAQGAGALGKCAAQGGRDVAVYGYEVGAVGLVQCVEYGLQDVGAELGGP